MTLIVAVKCRDGIVVGADGAATLGSMGQMTVRQPVKKLGIISDEVIVGVSGHVGLGQRLAGTMTELYQASAFVQNGKPLPPHLVMTLIRENFWKHINLEMQVAQVAQKLVGQSALNNALNAAVVAMPVAGQGCLFQFDPQGAPEEATENLPFIAIGSGQNTADPFLAFLRRNFWSDGLPSLADGTFAAYWTLEYAIKGAPGGISDPIQIITLSRGKKGWLAEELSNSDLQEHRQSVATAEQSLRDFRKGLDPATATSSNPPPSPPPPRG